MKRVNERGEIVSSEFSASSTDTYSPVYQLSPSVDQRNQFLKTTLIGSPIIYSIIGLILNQGLELYWEPFVAFIVGGIFGLVITAIYGYGYAKRCDSKDYLLGFTVPGLVLVAIGIGFMILVIAVFLFVLAGLASGGG